MARPLCRTELGVAYSKIHNLVMEILSSIRATFKRQSLVKCGLKLNLLHKCYFFFISDKKINSCCPNMIFFSSTDCTVSSFEWLQEDRLAECAIGATKYYTWAGPSSCNHWNCVHWNLVFITAFFIDSKNTSHVHKKDIYFWTSSLYNLNCTCLTS